MTEHFDLNEGWEFSDGGEFIPVRLPHTCKETPYDYFDENIYQMECTYRRNFTVPAEWDGKTILLTVGAAGHFARVYLDDDFVMSHACGYTAFTADLTGAAAGDHVISVVVDSREILDQPPFGFVIDYMTYGGIYREVTLDVKEKSYISDVFAKPRMDGTCISFVTCVNASGCTVRQSLSLDGNTVATVSAPAGEELSLKVSDVKVWDIVSPVLYTLKTELISGDSVVDTHTTRIGFRDIRFDADGFCLNNRKVKLRGLNRHQSYPYVGYAMPASMQRLDADILKNELGLNAVRTSHYPQSQHFIDRCDEIGLLVFTEIPGWQHIGPSDTWKDQVVENVREMVLQYRNHPSIILWGVRINESKDDDELYTRTNEMAHKLDPTRPTGGVRYLKKSSFLEDVYTYNDFLHSGDNNGCDPKKKVTSDMNKAYLVSEYNGHMYPTKMFDDEIHLMNHTLRHANVLDAVAAEEDIAGSFGWCFADYNTHKDFGSGDRICYHGVLDMYRNPKPAAAVYSVFQDDSPVLEVSSDMNIGEHPASNLGKIYILSNADSVRMYRNDVLLHEYKPEDSEYKHLPHGPILVTDLIGPRLETEEGMSHAQAELSKEILNYGAIFGYTKMPPKILAKAGLAMAKYHMTFEDAYNLYGKYIGNWGDKVTTFRFEAIKDGKVVKTIEKTPMTKVVIDADVDHTNLVEGATYDVAAIRVTARDQCGNRLAFFNESVALSVSGPIELIGPSTLQLRGGCGGTYVKTTRTPGTATLTLKPENAEEVKIEFEITKE